MTTITVADIKQWLEGEIAHNAEVVDAIDDVMTDGTDDIYVGRTECAQGLLEWIQERESKK